MWFGEVVDIFALYFLEKKFVHMKKVLALCLLFFAKLCFGINDAFLVKENEKILVSEGDCKKRYSPCSTFKIYISLMSYEEGLLYDETFPELPFNQDYNAVLDIHKQSHSPKLWMKNSCVWFSQILTSKMGEQKFKDYVQKLKYGNMDLSGDKSLNNGLTNCWLSSSLEISAEEQINLLQKLVNSKLPFSEKAQNMTRRILFVEELPNGWKLYGKTGSGFQLSKDRSVKLELKHGWFIGWIEKDKRKVIFAYHLLDDKKNEEFAGLRAKALIKNKLLNLIQMI